jgi:cytochrome c553
MKILISLSLTAALAAAALAAENPDWAYPVTPPPGQLDNVTMKSVPGSSQRYTQAQIDDPFNPPDWFSNEHPAMPQIVAHGGPKPAGRACAQCHLPSGDGHPESASLAGLPANYIIRQMATFKRGERNNPRAGVMIAMAQVLSDDDIRAAAVYFSGLKSTVGYNTVKETDTVTKSHVGAGGMRFATEGGETEPIGDRIIVLPKDENEAKLRDPHSGFIDNVPSGSIAKGQALATTGDGGRTIPCTLCHGPDLKGMGEVPPSSAGPQPTYTASSTTLRTARASARRWL